MEKIKVVIVDTEKGFRVEKIDNSLDKFYEIIKCRCIDIATRRIGEKKKYYDIIVDDEGLLVGSKISAINKEGKPQLVGNLIITNYDEEGNTTSLTDDDIEYIMEHTQSFLHKITFEVYHLLLDVEY